jgi:NDP-sugar pyrophosphorylase family protein
VKAFVLAAGAGTRLRPLTDDRPKPMIEVAGRPILGHTIARLAKAGVTDLVINLHHAGEVLTAYVGDGGAWGVRVQYSPEAELLGTAGAIVPWRPYFADGTFLVVYGDNLTTCRYADLLALHRRTGALATVALYWRDDPAQSGIADVGDDGRIHRFLEKPGPGQVFSHWVNAGVLALEPEALALMPAQGFSDFGRELLPRWVDQGRRVTGYRMSPGEGLWWIDTPEDLARVRRELEGRHDL